MEKKDEMKKKDNWHVEHFDPWTTHVEIEEEVHGVL